MNNTRIDGMPVTIENMAEIIGVRPRRIHQFIEATRNRAEKRRLGKKIDDPPLKVVKLVRLEFGIDLPLCKEYQSFRKSDRFRRSGQTGQKSHHEGGC